MDSEAGDWSEDKRKIYDFDPRDVGRDRKERPVTDTQDAESNIFENTTTKLPYLRDIYLKEKPTKQLVHYSAVVNGEVS